MPRSTAIQRFLARVKPELAASFTNEQLAAVELHFGMRHRVDHAIDWRKRVGLPFLKFYFVLLAGREQRATEKP
jgi:hypothetical protein